VAAPTAGLHFTQALLDTLAERSIGWTMLTLHVGPGIFLAVEVLARR
jgi:S-adenosylmethionine:tRNA ribosyltransferase-isomerase